MGNNNSVGRIYIDSVEYNLKLKEVKRHSNLLIIYLKPKKTINILDCKHKLLAGEIIASKITYIALDKNIEFEINFSNENYKLIRNNNGLYYEYGFNSGVIMENNAWINVSKSNIINRIICIVKNKKNFQP